MLMPCRLVKGTFLNAETALTRAGPCAQSNARRRSEVNPGIYDYE
jgi:hypothetical protein